MNAGEVICFILGAVWVLLLIALRYGVWRTLEIIVDYVRWMMKEES